MDTSSLSDSQKLDYLIGAIVEVKKSQVGLEKGQANLEALVTRVATLEATVADQAKTILSLQMDVKFLKERDNSRDQLLRGNALRLFHFPGSDSEVNLASKVYDKLLKPILVAAKAKGEITTLPQVGSVIEEIYRAGKFANGANKPPPPIIIKFSSSAIRMAILKNKRLNTPPPEGDAKRLVLSEDLTHATHRKMKELHADDRVSRVWSRSGSLWYVKNGANMPSVPVKSIYDDLNTILK